MAETVKSPQQKAIEEKDKGNAFFTQGKFSEAMMAYSRAISLDPSDPIFFSNLAQSLINLHRYDEAITNCNKAIAINSKHVKSYMRRATAFSALQKFDKAIADLEIATKLEPTNAKIKKDYDDAVEAYNTLKAAEAKREREKSQVAKRFIPTKRLDDVADDDDDGLEPPDPLSFALKKKAAAPTSTGNAESVPSRSTATAKSSTSHTTTASTSNAANGPSKQAKTKASTLGAAEQTALPKPALPAKAPTTFYSFEHHWVSVKRDQDVLAEYLKMLPVETLPKLFGDALSTEILSSIIHMIKVNYIPKGELDFAVSMFEALGRTSRIDFLVLLMSSGQQKELTDSFSELQTAVDSDSNLLARLLAVKPKLSIV